MVRNIEAFVPRVRFVFAPVCRIGSGWHEIRRRDYSTDVGLLRHLPLARSKLHYEHYAPHDSLPGRQFRAPPG